MYVAPQKRIIDWRSSTVGAASSPDCPWDSSSGQKEDINFFSFTHRRVIEIGQWEFGAEEPNHKQKVVAIARDGSDIPPHKESLHSDALKLFELTVRQDARDHLVVFQRILLFYQDSAVSFQIQNKPPVCFQVVPCYSRRQNPSRESIRLNLLVRIGRRCCQWLLAAHRSSSSFSTGCESKSHHDTHHSSCEVIEEQPLNPRHLQTSCCCCKRPAVSKTPKREKNTTTSAKTLPTSVWSKLGRKSLDNQKLCLWWGEQECRALRSENPW